MFAVLYRLYFILLTMNQYLGSVDPDCNFEYLMENNGDFKCKYVTPQDLSGFKVDQQMNLSIVNFNIRSFFKNIDEFLGLLRLCKHHFDVIVLTETWLNRNTADLCIIEGYNSFHSFRENCRGGGVSVFVDESFVSRKIEAVSINNGNFETVGVSLDINSLT